MSYSNGSHTVFHHRYRIVWLFRSTNLPASAGSYSVIYRQIDPIIETNHCLAIVNAGVARCSVPMYNGTESNAIDKEGRWARFFTGAPVRRRRSVERYKIDKHKGVGPPLRDQSEDREKVEV